MKISTMRKIDAWAGVPLCFIISKLRWPRPNQAAQKSGKILVIKLAELGALVALEPAMRRLLESTQRENLYFLTFAEGRGMLELLDYLPPQNILTLRTDSIGQFLWDVVTCLRRLRGLGLECSIDMDFFSRATALISWMSAASRRVGCHAYFGEGSYRGELMTHPVKFNPHLHASRVFEILAQAAFRSPEGLPRFDYVPSPPSPPVKRFVPSAEEKSSVARMLSGVGVPAGAAIILLNANSRDLDSVPLRKWADSNYVDLARMILSGRPDAYVLLTGGPGDAPAVAKIEEQIGNPRCRSVAGKTTLQELLTLYGMSVVMVTNDSGPAHFATLTDMNVVVLFGPERPALWQPLGEHVHVVYRGLACSPCLTIYNDRQSACKRNICLDIPAREIHEIVDKIISERVPA